MNDHSINSNPRQEPQWSVLAASHVAPMTRGPPNAISQLAGCTHASYGLLLRPLEVMAFLHVSGAHLSIPPYLLTVLTYDVFVDIFPPAVTAS